MRLVRTIFIIVLLAGMFFLPMANAGLHPLNTLVVVNDNSALSQSLGHYYQTHYQIPEANICHISISTNYNMTTATFSNDLRNPVLNHIQQQNLTNQITTILLSRDIPYRVYGTNNPSTNINSTTSAMFYGFKHSDTIGSLPTYTTSAYFSVETAFTKSGYPDNYICMMLTSWTLDESLRLIDRSMTANNACPTGTVFLLHSTDTARNVEWPQFNTTSYLCRFLDIPRQVIIRDENTLANQTNVSGCTVGQKTILTDIYSNTFTPGAIADNLTSCAGYLFDSADQMSLLHWLRAGCTASYGTCVEPYNYTNKFPNMEMYYWYGRGFSAGESFYMSVHNPYEGVFGGDPLCAPYALPADIQVQGPAGSCSNTTAITINISAADTTRPVDQVLLYIGGKFEQVLTNISPAAGNAISATINGTTRSTTLQSGDSLADAAQRLRNRINQPPSIGFTGKGRSDRVTILQNSSGVSAAGVGCSANTDPGTAGDLTVFAYVPETNFLETIYPTRQKIYLSGTPAEGDIITATIKNLNNIITTNTITASSGETSIQLMTRLMSAINADSNLTGTCGCQAKYQLSSTRYSYSECQLLSRTNTYEAAGLHLSFQLNTQSGSTLYDSSYNGAFQSNLDEQKNQATIFISCGRTNLSLTPQIDTTLLADGPHTLHIVAREGTAVGTLSSAPCIINVRNTDISCTITSPANMANLSTGISFNIYASAASSATTITGIQLIAEGKITAQTNTLPAVFTLSTDTFGPGIIHLQAEAQAQNGTSALSDPVEIHIYQDQDNDGMPSWWEYQYFGGSTNALPNDDPDSDTADNLSEYIALTTPTDGTSCFQTFLSILNATNYLLQFTSTTQRYYNIFYNSDLTSNIWTPAFSSAISGWSQTTLYTNTTTNAHQYYRINTIVP